MSGSNKITIKFLMVIIIAAFLFSCLSMIQSRFLLDPSTYSPPTVNSQYPLRDGDSIAEVVKKASPAVVNIKTSVDDRGMGLQGWLKALRGLFMLRPGQEYEEASIGSGFFISEDGYLLTNQHVIEGASEIIVNTRDQKEYQAKVVGQDYDSDLAVLKIAGSDPISALELGNSDLMLAGDWVVAIGNPYGLDQTVTVGVVSAKGRPVRLNDRVYRNLIQTDAAINPGNSGGPLLNIRGEVVGINTAVNAQAQGIGFAIPINTVHENLEELIKYGRIRRPYLGMYVRDSQRSGAAGQGVIVAHVIKNSPADRAGICEMDEVKRFNDVYVHDALHFEILLERTSIGEPITLSLLRKGRHLICSFTVGEKPY